MSKNVTTKQIAKDLYLEANNVGNHKYSLAQISEIITKKCYENVTRMTLNRWVKSWEHIWEQSIQVGTLEALKEEAHKTALERREMEEVTNDLITQRNAREQARNDKIIDYCIKIKELLVENEWQKIENGSKSLDQFDSFEIGTLDKIHLTALKQRENREAQLTQGLPELRINFVPATEKE